MKNKLLILSVIFLMFLTSCSKISDDEHTAFEPNSTVKESDIRSETKIVRVTEPNTVRLNGDYDSVPTVTFPQKLSSEELDSIVIPVSADDPYSAIVASKIDWYKQAGPEYNSELMRYTLHDINGDGTDELIIGRIEVLGGTSVYDEYEGVSADFVYGLLMSEVFTIQNGKAVRVQRSTLSPDAYENVLFDNGILKVVRLTPRNPRITYAKMVNGVFELVGDCIYKTFDGKYYYRNGSDTGEITEEEFNRRIAEIEDGAHPVELEWKHLQDYGK